MSRLGRAQPVQPVFIHGFPVAVVFNDAGTGTITLSGAKTESASYADSRSGTITLTGSATEQWGIIFNDSRAGTITLSGSRSESQSQTSARSGTITLGGSGIESFIPPPSGSTAGWREQTVEIVVVRGPH